MTRLSTLLLYAAAAALFQIATAPGAFADPILPSPLASFAVLGATTVTNTGSTTLLNGGNVGVDAGSEIVPGATGFTFAGGGTSIVGGIANAAQTQLDIALGLLGGLAPTGSPLISGGILDGLTLTQGVYAVSAADGVGGFNLSGGTLTLNAQGASNPFWVFQMSSTLNTLSDSTVLFSNQGSSFNPGVYWAVGSSATLGTNTTFQGNILALTSITLETGATIGCGSALAATGAVTMDTNTIGIGCNGSLTVGTTGPGGGPVVFGPPGPGGTPGTPLPIPEPGTLLLLGTGIACLVARRPRWAR